jgi:D-alanine-D-alanine ligase-like ATP-grasp enzyme
MATATSLPYCTDCGEARVAHGLNKSQFQVGEILDLLAQPLVPMGKRLTDLLLTLQIDRAVLPVMRVLAKRGLGTLSQEFDERDTIRTKALFDGAKLAGVTLYQFRLFDTDHDGIFVATKGEQQLVFLTMPRPRGFNSPSLDWMDDKGELKRFLLAHDFPTAQGGVARTRAQALAIFDRIGPPLITKPHHGTRGRHTTIGIHTREALERAFEIANQISPQVIVERELTGIVHRVTLIGMRSAAIARRDYPCVTGDGVSTLTELLEIENRDPRRDEFAFYKIQPNERAVAQLEAQQLDWDSVPEKGRRVILNDKISRLHGTVTFDVTDIAHPDNVALFDRLGELLGDPVVGVDFMIGDITKPWHEQPGAGLVECNAMPYIDLHHYPFEGAPRPIAKDLWDFVFARGA